MTSSWPECTWFLFVLVGLGSELHACKADTLPLDPHLQFILLCLFWRCDLANHLSGLALKP
jgi:hypothetical protein